MANELVVVEENWLELAGKFNDLPMPFERTVFLTECHLAGTAEIDDMLVRTKNVEVGTQLVLKRNATDAQDKKAVAAQTADGALVGAGTHAELLEHCAIYREIYHSQTGGGAA